MAPPARAQLPGGGEADLAVLAAAVADRHLAAHPDEVERYGPVGREWCVHDNQHLINWAIEDVRGDTSLDEQVAWLANVLGSRGYPLDSLGDDLLTAAEVLREVGDPDLATAGDRLEAAASSMPGSP